jgi:endonuclease YncB( thermonuclease family)
VSSFEHLCCAAHYLHSEDMKALKIKIYLGACVALVACLAAAAEAAPGTLSGVASVIDGDTIEIHGEQVRLNGFDTPEEGARCGAVNVYQAAALALSDFIGTQTVDCALSGKDRYKRHIGTCRVDGAELGEHMVLTGWGRDWLRYSKGAYAGEEKTAREAKAGIWGLECPADLWGDRNYE